MSTIPITWPSTTSNHKKLSKFFPVTSRTSTTQGGEERWTALGQTASGRFLVIVWTMLDDGSYRPITAYPASKDLQSVYRRLIQGT
jgi:uncharacterized DUF497 family protein